MEKRKPTYDLASFRFAFRDQKSRCATKTALDSARELGFTLEEMNEAIQSMKRTHFFKSMTSFTDHTMWQDVYHVPFDGLVLYVKFCADRVTEFRLLSFKEK